jgi:hypothetical protein
MFRKDEGQCTYWESAIDVHNITRQDTRVSVDQSLDQLDHLVPNALQHDMDVRDDGFIVLPVAIVEDGDSDVGIN